MIQLQQILVATDFSEVSTAAVDYGRALARAFGASLHLLHVMENPFLRPTAADPHTIESATQRHLFERLTDEDRTALHATAALEMSDDPAEEIVKYAKTNAIDLIVLGTHGRGGMAHLLLGSVAERVVRTAPCPVLTVRHPEREFVIPDTFDTTLNTTRGPLMIALEHILVATDFSEPSHAALTYGAALARNFGATLHVVHVVGSVPTLVYAAEAYAASMPELQQELDDSARKQLAALLVDSDQQPMAVRPVVITSNAAALAIVDYAARERIDLIVTGTQGRGGVAHLLMGSVAERVVRTAPCPVLTVRHPEHEFVVPDALVAVAKA